MNEKKKSKKITTSKISGTPYHCECCRKEIKHANQCTWIRIVYTLEKYNTKQFEPKTKNLIKNSLLLQIGIPICNKCLKNNTQITKALNSKYSQTKNYKKRILKNINEINSLIRC